MKFNDLKKQKNVEVLEIASQKKLKGGGLSANPAMNAKCPPPILGGNPAKAQ